MSFEIVKLSKEVFSGEQVEIPVFDPRVEGFGPMSEVKAAAIAKYAANDTDYVAINASIDGKQCYLVAKAGTAGSTSFEIPEGEYAKFVSQETDRTALDAFIGQSYGELSQSETVGIGGTFNLEDLRESSFTVYIPVQSKQ
ncbi:hypothetical protein HCB27_04510 [Listeria booriae]|uniref:Integron-associated effector binding protein domain-containing protein n=1 Tax=Listeria booriae TaxID=1552123 RepID=A0A7X0Z5P9_9LIST|nr:effector binding domain-containing protein [Listeria booriae]MBC2175864.1 hypothetical protein [Listeria booriae]